MSHSRPFRENANESPVEPMASRIWRRPWMCRLGMALMRLGTVLVVAASPASAVAGWIVAVNAYPSLLGPPAWIMVLLMAHTASVIVAGVILSAVASTASRSDPLTPAFAMRVAWAWIAYPVLLLVMVAKWIINGSQEDS